jgi:hypothetical protein
MSLHDCKIHRGSQTEIDWHGTILERTSKDFTVVNREAFINNKIKLFRLLFCGDQFSHFQHSAPIDRYAKGLFASHPVSGLVLGLIKVSQL